MGDTITQTFRADDKISPVLEKISVAAAKSGVSMNEAAKAVLALDASAKSGASAQGALRKELASLSADLKTVAAEGGKASAALGKISEGGVNVKQNWAIAAAGLNSAVQLVARAGKAVAEPFQNAFQFERAAARLAPLVGGLKNAKTLAGDLRDEAARAGVPFETLAGTARKLASVFSSQEKIRTWTSAFKDLSAGLGQDINKIVESFVKAKASGKLDSSFLDMFASKGVNLFKPLSEMTGATESELRKMAAAGTLAFSDVERAILSTVSAGGVFADAAENLSQTAGGAVERLRAQWEILLAKIAEPCADALTPIISAAAKAVEFFSRGASTMIGRVGALAIGGGVAVGALVSGFKTLRASIVAATVAARAFGIGMKTAIASSGVGLIAVGIGSLVSYLTTQADDAEARREEAEREAADAAREAAAEAAAAERRDNERAARRRETRRRELEEEYARAARMREDIEREIQSATIAAENAPSVKIGLELTAVGVGSVNELNREIEGLRDYNALTAEQEERLKRLLDTRKSIRAVEEAAASARRSLQERVQLMQAELAGQEQLLAVKEKLYRMELRSQFIKAGVSAEAADARVEDFIRLENQVKAQRAAKEEAEKARRELESTVSNVVRFGSGKRTEEQLRQQFSEAGVASGNIEGVLALYKQILAEKQAERKAAESPKAAIQAAALAAEKVVQFSGASAAKNAVAAGLPGASGGNGGGNLSGVASAVPAVEKAFAALSSAAAQTAENTRQLVELARKPNSGNVAAILS